MWRRDARGPDYAALSAFHECDFAPVSMFFKMLAEERSVVNLNHYHLGPQGATAISRSIDSSRHIGTLVSNHARADLACDPVDDV